MTQQKMTENNKSSDLIKDLAIAIKEVGSERDKPRPEQWHERKLITFPNGGKHYLTSDEIKAKKIVDDLVAKKTLSSVASEAAMNKFFSLSQIRSLPSKEIRFFAKMYYKQNILDWSVIKK